MRKFLSLFLVMALAACGDATGLSTEMRGTYDLYSVNGERLPYSLGYDPDLGVETVLYEAELTINSNGTFREDVAYEEYYDGQTYPRQVLETFVGTYRGTRSSFTLTYEELGGETYEGEYTGDAIILYADGAQVVYRRR